jgi:hypothetical protein
MTYAEISEQYPIGLSLHLKGRYMVGGVRYRKTPAGMFSAIRTDKAGLDAAEEACKKSREINRNRNPNISGS